MAADIVNLRMARKRRDRAEREKTAEKNRYEHGRSKAERDLARALNRQSDDRHSAQRLDRPDDPDGERS